MLLAGGSMALSVGVRRLSHLPGRGERQVQLSFRGGPRGQGGRYGWGLSSWRESQGRAGCGRAQAFYLFPKASHRRRGKFAVARRPCSGR